MNCKAITLFSTLAKQNGQTSTKKISYHDSAHHQSDTFAGKGEESVNKIEK